MSKVALNMYGVKLGRELAPVRPRALHPSWYRCPLTSTFPIGQESFTVVLVHPGYVQTDMVRFSKMLSRGQVLEQS